MAYYISQRFLMEAVEGKILALIDREGRNIEDFGLSTREIKLRLRMKRVKADKAAKWLLK